MLNNISEFDMILTRGDLVKILAKRSDAIFYISAVVVPASVLLLVNINKICGFIEGYGFSGMRLKWSIIFYAILSFSVCVYNFFQRLTVPKVVIEYDDNFIYINKTKNEPTIVLRFSEYKGGFSQEVVGDNTESVGVFSTASVLRIQTNNGIINVYGIANCTKVKLELNRLAREYDKRSLEKYYGDDEQDF